MPQAFKRLFSLLLPSAFELCSDDPGAYCTNKKIQRWTKTRSLRHCVWTVNVTGFETLIIFTAPSGLQNTFRHPWPLLHKQETPTMNKVHSSLVFLAYAPGSPGVRRALLIFLKHHIFKSLPQLLRQKNNVLRRSVNAEVEAESQWDTHVVVFLVGRYPFRVNIQLVAHEDLHAQLLVFIPIRCVSMTFQQGADFDTVKSSDQCFRVTDFMLNTQKDKIAVHDWDNRRKKNVGRRNFFREQI